MILALEASPTPPHPIQMAKLSIVQQLLHDSIPPLLLLLILRWIFVKTVFRFLRSPHPTFVILCKLSQRLIQAVSTLSLLFAIIVGWGPVKKEIENCLPAQAPRPHSLVMVSCFSILISTCNFTPCLTAFASLIVASRASPYAFLLALVGTADLHIPIVSLFTYILCIFSALLNTVHCKKAMASDAILMGIGTFLFCRWTFGFAFDFVCELRSARSKFL